MPFAPMTLNNELGQQTNIKRLLGLHFIRILETRGHNNIARLQKDITFTSAPENEQVA